MQRKEPISIICQKSMVCAQKAEGGLYFLISYIRFLFCCVYIRETFVFYDYSKNGVNRAVTVYKREGSSIVQADPMFTLCPTSRLLIRTLLVECPITAKERQDLMPQLERDREREKALYGEGIVVLIIFHLLLFLSVVYL